MDYNHLQNVWGGSGPYPASYSVVTRVWGWWEQLGHEVVPCLDLVSGLRMSGALPLLNFLFIEYWGVLFLRIKQPVCVVNHLRSF